MLIDGIPGFEEAFFLSKNSEITLEFMDPEDILCYFNAVQNFCQDDMGGVHRDNLSGPKGQVLPVERTGGTEIVFRVTPEIEERAMVRDYSLEGLSFLRDEPFL